MGFQITGMALKNLLSRPATKLYPVEPQVYTTQTRGHVDNNMDACILCSICVRKCPATALAVDKEARTWTINPFSCVQCMACVRACPRDSLSMLPEYTAVAQSMSTRTLVKPEDEDE
ncbi:MAG: 4Fe-4S binding protein [Coriobacteriales bacterium]|jgi:ech hydrogenase subunit F|nr:4Fe-4S binding protein [Coriobacteriales bacterium]